MPKAADGQYEMVLENRHVMTLFFVVIVLCGVFFGLGYIVGKNSLGTATTAAAAPQDAAAGATEPGKKSPLDQAAEKKSDTSDLTFQKTLEDKSPTPALEAAPAAAAPQAAAAAAPVAPAPAAETKPAPVPPATAAASSTIIQVGALKSRADADGIAATLRVRGFSPVVELQNDGLYHVYIPASAKEAADVKSRVENAGFKAFIKRK